MENTTRGFGWRFLEIGRRIERTLQMLLLLRHSLRTAPAELEATLQVLLQIADSSITYRSRYPTVLQADFVLQLLIADESNPRAVGFQLATLLHQIIRLQENEGDSNTSREHTLAVQALESVRSAQAADLARRDADAGFGALEELNTALASTLWELSDGLTERYFSNLIACRLTASS
jgi:uncharacterized alpha-E superfamily protein